MPGFEWSSGLDWAPYESPIALSSPLTSYQPNDNSSVSMGCSTAAHAGQMCQPLDMLTPSPIHDEKFVFNPTVLANQPSDCEELKVLGVDLENLREGGSRIGNGGASCEANKRLLTDLTKSFTTLTPPPSPINNAPSNHNHTKQKIRPRVSPKTIVTTKNDKLTATKKCNKESIATYPREIKANHMDCHDYTNKVQYTKVSPKMQTSNSMIHHDAMSTRFQGGNVQITNFIPAPFNNKCEKNGGKKPVHINRVTELKTKIVEVDDPEYLAHGTGIPR